MKIRELEPVCVCADVLLLNAKSEFRYFERTFSSEKRGNR